MRKTAARTTRSSTRKTAVRTLYQPVVTPACCYKHSASTQCFSSWQRGIILLLGYKTSNFVAHRRGCKALRFDSKPIHRRRLPQRRLFCQFVSRVERWSCHSMCFCLSVGLDSLGGCTTHVNRNVFCNAAFALFVARRMNLISNFFTMLLWHVSSHN
jgi:hypothetical protein